MYQQTTKDITVRVKPIYLEDQSAPDEGRYVWAYNVMIENHGNRPVRLQNRYWHITDGYGRFQEVHGSGVVGEHPLIPPGGIFEYTSGTPLPTPTGIMVGKYSMITNGGEQFDVDIPAFSLDSPYFKPTVN